MEAPTRNKPPGGLDADERVVFDCCTELQTQRAVSDATWAGAIQRFDEQGVADLTGIVGYYTLPAMVMNAARMPAPPGTDPQVPGLA